jgi:hypothetical protein
MATLHDKTCDADKARDGAIDYICGKPSKGGHTRKVYPTDLSALTAEVEALATEVRFLRAALARVVGEL